MDKIRIGLVGIGPRGESWVAQINQNPWFDIVALCDLYQYKLDSVVTSMGLMDISLYTDFEEMLDKTEMDAVGVCTAPLDQCDLICKAMDAGKHVICEVPISYDILDCWKVVVTAERTGVKFQMAEQTRFWNYMRIWKKLVEEGKLGKVVYAEGQYWADYGLTWYRWEPSTGQYVGHDREKWKNSGVYDNFRIPKHAIAYPPHELSPMLMVLNDRVKVVSCMSNSRNYTYPELDRPNFDVAIMRTDNDTLMKISCGFTTPVVVPHHWYQFVGTQGSVEWRRASWDKPKLYLKQEGCYDWKAMDWTEESLDGPAEAIQSGHGGVDYYPFATFADSILNGKEIEVDVYTAAEASAPGIVAAISAEQGGQPYEVPQFRPGFGRNFGEYPSSLELKKAEA